MEEQRLANLLAVPRRDAVRSVLGLRRLGQEGQLPLDARAVLRQDQLGNEARGQALRAQHVQRVGVRAEEQQRGQHEGQNGLWLR